MGLHLLKQFFKKKLLHGKTNGLCFHSIHKEQEPFFLKNIHSLSFQNFRTVISRVQKNAKILSLQEYIEEIPNTKTKITTITFDDAYKNILDQAIPYLEAEKLPATIFVNSSTLTGQMLWRDQIRVLFDSQLMEDFIEFINDRETFSPDNIYFRSKEPDINSAGFKKKLDNFFEEKKLPLNCNFYMSIKEVLNIDKSVLFSIGNHSKHHYLLSSLSDTQQKEEINKGFDELIEKGLHVEKVFAAPFGGYHTVSEATFKTLYEQDYKALLLTNGKEKVNRKKLPCDNNLVIANRYLPNS